MLLRAAIAMVVLATALVAAPTPAQACSCLAMSEPTLLVDATALAKETVRIGDFDTVVWTFDVVTAERGAVAGDRVVVETFENSSCASGPQPVARGTYRIAGLGGTEVVDGRPLFHGGSCGGSIELLAGPPSGPVGAQGPPAPAADDEPRTIPALLAFAALAAAGTMTWRARRA